MPKKKMKKSVPTTDPETKKAKPKKIRVVDTRTDIHIGDYARDKLTGFEGIVTAEVTYLHGCNQLCLNPTKLKKDGGTMEGLYFDFERIERVKAGKGFKKGYKMESIPVDDPGGPQDHPKARN